MTQTKRERVVSWIHDILETEGEWMSARQIADRLIDYVPKNVREYQRSRRHDTVSSVTVGLWLLHDRCVLKRQTRKSTEYRWVGEHRY